eukprot:Pgem_evm1s7128
MLIINYMYGDDSNNTHNKDHNAIIMLLGTKVKNQYFYNRRTIQNANHRLY